MNWRTLVGLGGMGWLLAACGGAQPAAAPTAESVVTVVTVTPAVRPTVATPTVVATPTPPASPPTPTVEAETSNTVYVANTDGQGVFIRKTPVMADRLRAYPDGTALTLAGEDVDGDGQHWHHVKTPDGAEGYVPAMYTADTPP